ncbi:MAG: glycosyl hydrolase family 8 [Asticcacaulis sp.]
MRHHTHWLAGVSATVVLMAGMGLAPAFAQTPSVPAAATAFPGDGKGAYKTHQYHNLFVERLGHSEAETKAKIDAAFHQLFHGDGQEQTVYFETGANENGTLAYITDWANNDARSEGMSYGMMIAVQLDKKREFDAIWNWANTYMLTTDPNNPSLGYFAWSMGTDGSPRATGAAPDGEEYFVMALYFAAHRWGNGEGIYNYKAQADKILSHMRHRALMTGTPPFKIKPDGEPFVQPDHPWPSPNNRAAAAEAIKAGRTWPPQMPANMPKREPRPVTVGPMVDEASTMIRFVPETNIDGSDASYHLPAFYELWSRWGPVEDRAFWAKAADVSRNFFVQVTDPKTGLAPDRSNFDGTPAKGWDGKPSQFAYDAWRVASNWSVDYSWWGKDPRQVNLSQNIQSFLYGQGINTFADRYSLDGQPMSERHSTGMVAATTVASLASGQNPTSDAFLKTLWDTPVPEGEQRYFDGLVYLMSLMHISGEFRIIDKPE